MSVEAFLESKASLREKLARHENLDALRENALELQNQLNELSKELTPYDLQKHFKELDELLKDINARVPPQVVKLEFKKKPKPRLFRNRPKRCVTDKTVTQSEMVSEQDFNIVQANAVYENLQSCKIIGTHTINDTGSLTFKDLESCVIIIYEPTFREGSIVISNCNDCSIYIHTGKEAQLRLHDLKDCKLMIRPSQAPQRIVMERCSECTFDEVCKTWVSIQEFDNLGLTQGPPSYTFKTLEDWW